MSIKQFPGGIITKNPTAPTTAAAKGIWTLGQAADFVKQGIWPRSPGAPTIGTATVSGSTSVSVAFTTPTDLGAGTLTFTATSSPGSLTGTGSSSPVTVTGLTTGTPYTFTVTAATPGGTSLASAASNSATPAMQPGEAFGGGFFAGQISTAGNSIADYNLVVGPVASAQSTLAWKTSNTSTAGTSSAIDGPANSTAMNNASHPAAQFCEGLTIGGFSDWYMPAKNELEVCYYNLKPTTDSNETGSGINPNAVPARASPYTAGTPAQTSAANFKNTGTEDFLSVYYWASTEIAAVTAYVQNFGGVNSGFQRTGIKSSSDYVRAVRRVAV